MLGPAEDGGYYLLGMKAPHIHLFEDIAWSTGDDRPAWRGRQETARFPRALSTRRPAAFFVSRILRRAARSRVRLTEPALSLKQRASNPSSSLS
ncbi:MAG: DUF2064 domain-containing protein [Stellaceae bacterium]